MEEKKPKKMRIDVLKRKIEQGKMLCKSDYQYTDDYQFDKAYDFGKTDWMECRIAKDYNDFQSGKINLFEYEFKGKGRHIWNNDDGTITFHPHSNSSFRLKEKK